MTETIVVAMLAAKIRGYKLKPFFKTWEIYPVFLFVIVYLLLNLSVFMGNYSFVKYAGIIETAYFCTFFILIFRYKQYISAIVGSACVFIGTILNKVAITANSGKMPVFPTISYVTGYVKPDSFEKANDIHILGSASTNLKFLTDIIDLGYSVLSIGDIFIRVFTFIIIFNTIKSINISLKRCQYVESNIT